jgi:predicted molibdopterin-dependent oxidoreductase YjgC
VTVALSNALGYPMRYTHPAEIMDEIARLTPTFAGVSYDLLDRVALMSRAGETALRARITDRVQPGVVYTTFHHPETGANVVTTEYSDWATNCPEYKVTAVEVRPTNRWSTWQVENEEFRHNATRITTAAE